MIKSLLVLVAALRFTVSTDAHHYFLPLFYNGLNSFRDPHLRYLRYPKWRPEDTFSSQGVFTEDMLICVLARAAISRDEPTTAGVNVFLSGDHDSSAESDDIINLNTHFNKIEKDDQLKEYVREILERLETFKVPVHPRIRLFYQLLHKKVAQFADRTADSIFVPYKYRNEDDDDDDSMKIEA